MKFTRNLLLGGAQFGKGYGKHINTPELSNFGLSSLLEFALSNGIQQIDLAQNYKSAVDNLSKTAFASKFKYTTKIQYAENEQNEIMFKLRLELSLLGVVSFQTVLIHNWAALSVKDRISAIKFVELLVKDGVCIEVGVSVYDIWELEFLDWCPNIVQAPLNFYNRQFLGDDIALSLRARGTKFVARSIFHQGLLLNPRFKDRFPDLEDFINFCKANDFSYLHGALSVFDTQDIFQDVVVGVAAASQLEEILATKVSTPKEIRFPESRIYNSNFVDPRKW